MIEDEGETNLAQMTEAVLQDGYAIVQEFVDGGEDGDARIFLLEGRILERDGKLAAFRRVPTGNDPRANISAGGRSVPLEIGDVELGIVEAMSEKLVADGMFFVGIDVIGDKVVEINAESPGGMQSVERLYDIDVCPTVIDALERRAGATSVNDGGAPDAAAAGARNGVALPPGDAAKPVARSRHSPPRAAGEDGDPFGDADRAAGCAPGIAGARLRVRG